MTKNIIIFLLYFLLGCNKFDKLMDFGLRVNKINYLPFIRFFKSDGKSDKLID